MLFYLSELVATVQRNRAHIGLATDGETVWANDWGAGIVFEINFDTDPEKADHLKSIIFREIDKIVADGPTQEDLDKVILNMKKERAQAKEHNGYWMNALYNKYYHGFNPDAEENFDAILDGLIINRMAKRFCSSPMSAWLNFSSTII